MDTQWCCPRFFNGVSDDGPFAFCSETIQRVDEPRLRVYLYHIPQVTRVPMPHDLIERQRRANPAPLPGIKDGPGDWDNTAR